MMPMRGLGCVGQVVNSGPQSSAPGASISVHVHNPNHLLAEFDEQRSQTHSAGPSLGVGGDALPNRRVKRRDAHSDLEGSGRGVVVGTQGSGGTARGRAALRQGGGQ